MEFKQSLLNYIGGALKDAKESVSVAESVTAGYLQFSFSQMKDASDFFKGGITAYTLEEKVKLLKVDEQEARRCDCVSKKIADEMAPMFVPGTHAVEKKRIDVVVQRFMIQEQLRE